MARSVMVEGPVRSLSTPPPHFVRSPSPFREGIIHTNIIPIHSAINAGLSSPSISTVTSWTN